MVFMHIALALAIGTFYALIVLVSGMISSAISVAVMLLAVRIAEGMAVAEVLRNPSVRYACLVSLPFSVMGVGIGYLCGISREPAIGNVIPAVLTIFAAGSTYFYAKGKPEALVAFVAMISMCLALVFGLTMGAALRPH